MMSANFVLECNWDIAIAGIVAHSDDVLEMIRVEIDRVRVEHHPKPGTLGIFRIQKSHLAVTPPPTTACEALDADSLDVPPLIKTSPRAIVVEKSFKTFILRSSRTQYSENERR